jgi:RHS repeat-associated protein
MWTWFADPFGTTAANPNPQGAGTFPYNIRFAGQVYDGQAGLHQNFMRDYDPAIGKYAESDPLGMKAGVNTYAYVKDNPEAFSDPTGLQAASTWGCDGAGNYVPFVKDTNPCTADCTKAHEESHIADAKAKWGTELCRGKPPGYIPTDPKNLLPGRDLAYWHKTECRAFRVEDACLARMEGKCGCKDAAHARRYSAEAGISEHCE